MSMMKAVSINAVRNLGKAVGARRVVVLALNGEKYSVATWGATRAECSALAKWAESDAAVATLWEIADVAPETGTISTAGAPGVDSKLGVE